MKKIVLLLNFVFVFGAFPDWFYKIPNIYQQKKAFVEILLPLIKNENRKILSLRRELIKIFNTPNYITNKKYVAFLSQIAKRYRIKDITNKREFLIKINTIPNSLVLAQAALESGWGKSRFVREANNIFGHWEYSKNGLAPKDRYKHVKISYTLKVFNSLEDSIAAYMLNLNRNPAYIPFRLLRYKYFVSNKKFTGLIAAATLANYSQLKEVYVKRLQRVIRVNNLQKYDD